MTRNFTLSEIMGPVVGSTFLSQLGTFSLLQFGQSIFTYLFFLTVQFGPIGLVSGTLGAHKMVTAKNSSLRKIFSFFLVFALFGIFYRVTDQFTFFIPSYVFWAMLMGVGADHALRLATEKRRSLAPVLLGLLIITAPVFYISLPSLATRIGLSDSSMGIPEIGVGVRNGLAYYMNPNKWGDDQAYAFGSQTILNLPPNSIVIAEWYTDTDEYFILRYFTKVDKLRPDVSVLGWPTHDPFTFDPQLVVDVIEDSFAQHPVYLASLSESFYSASNLIEKYCIVPENNLYRLYSKEGSGLQCLEKDALTE
jgi:hypothetical protein